MSPSVGQGNRAERLLADLNLDKRETGQKQVSYLEWLEIGQ